MAAQSPTGVLVLRVWWEPAHPPALRARLLVVDDPREAPVEYATAAGTEDVTESVRAWLQEWSDKARARGGDG
ncbi:hypothetical protein [Streptomyces sp. CMB-StM0423]|uniref:hypothetical protein n=1 Tax=Streptomyces sp. CMB-StM0423 TaxID=2059884 RepID=UPI00131BFA1C|nr:hypothetical protein [Streptomyces sp. CMB-StM0423]